MQLDLKILILKYGYDYIKKNSPVVANDYRLVGILFTYKRQFMLTAIILKLDLSNAWNGIDSTFRMRGKPPKNI